MPIRPENRARYPKGWAALSRHIRFIRAKGRCECEGECGTGHEARCVAQDGFPHPDTRSKVVLTVAHLDHTPEHCEEGNLKAMCQRCHNAYDMPMRRAGIKARAREALGMADLFN